MPRILLLVLIILAFWYGWQHLKTRSPEQRKRTLWVWGSALLLIIAVVLVASGRMHWVGAAIAAAIPLIKVMLSLGLRALPLLRLWQGRTGRPSRIRTRGMELTVNLATGEMDGVLFSGPHAGAMIASLDEQQLRAQLDFFRREDFQSAMLLRAYLARRGFSGLGGDSNREGTGTTEQVMGTDEALRILGLEPGASREEILRAHKRLIQKLHPDRGGNDYLAAKINAARDRLVERET